MVFLKKGSESCRSLYRVEDKSGINIDGISLISHHELSLRKDAATLSTSIEETKELLRVQAENTAQYASGVAEDFQERAEQLEMSYSSDEEMNDEIDRMSQETKEIASHIEETTKLLKAFRRHVARRDLGEEQERSLMDCVKEAFHTAFRAVTECFRLICEKVLQGWLKCKEGVQWVVQEVKASVRRAISYIRQLFQLDVYSGYAL
ncbi:hypothetical protein BDV33DRAFT_198389 [Aspergillus novoparasiticus]|uniref:Uncharacterized protein n=1 Tax=Aspergillus novoparasiticus TaxID=986946 RepID=A0A5N6F8S3_9EURO|nr:hypothetical protein BDV33DRAFT_198389 [Aspergillus novoparasiticus]